MWKFIAFSLVVLLILMFIQASTLTDEEIARLREKVEQQKATEKQNTAITDSEDLNSPVEQPQ